MRYIALLRGINVGGKKKIKMIDLKILFELLKFENVKTYIQSGNVIFDFNATDEIKLAYQIEHKISETYGFLVKIIIRTQYELRDLVINNPFIKEPDIQLDQLYVTLMSDIPDPNKVLQLNVKKEENERFLIIKREVYLYCPNGYGRTKLNNAMYEKRLNIIATTRNWKTITKLIQSSNMVY